MARGVVALLRVQVNASLRQAVAHNQQFINPGANFMLLNGLSIDINELDYFGEPCLEREAAAAAANGAHKLADVPLRWPTTQQPQVPRSAWPLVARQSHAWGALSWRACAGLLDRLKSELQLIELLSGLGLEPSDMRQLMQMRAEDTSDAMEETRLDLGVHKGGRDADKVGGSACVLLSQDNGLPPSLGTMHRNRHGTAPWGSESCAGQVRDSDGSPPRRALPHRAAGAVAQQPGEGRAVPALRPPDQRRAQRLPRQVRGDTRSRGAGPPSGAQQPNRTTTGVLPATPLFCSRLRAR